MKGRNELLKLKVNLGVVFRGEVSAIQHFLDVIQGELTNQDDVETVYQSVSASKLWIKEGDIKSD
ncbi:MAG: hypothetical protein ACXADD_18750 [Candidatus Thorarchaeota archaeon]|jgi:hypothetical protein